MRDRYLRILITSLLIAGMVLGLCACGGRAESSAPAATPTPAPATPAPTPEPTPEPAPEPIDGELLTDDDGDGIINYKFHYKGATVYALIVLDPSRVFVGTAMTEQTGWGGYGITIDAAAEQYNAVAGINAGGFIDAGGTGGGWPPEGITYSRGLDYTVIDTGLIAALNNNDKMVVGYYDHDVCDDLGIRDSVAFGPILVQNGVKKDPANMESGIGSRTAIGQREDGAIVMVVIDGRQGYSIGVTFADCIDIMADKFGCVNASNMDGGNSTCMYYAGEAVNRSSNKAGGTRNLPDYWLVHALPDNYVKPESVPERIVLPDNALGELREYKGSCDAETSARMYDFACAFMEAYYGYFGTQGADYYYPTLMQYVATGSELRNQMDLALMDRTWVNTWRTEALNIVLNGAYDNGDGSYDILVSSDIYEYSEYWNYESLNTPLRITVVEAPETAYGFLATAVY